MDNSFRGPALRAENSTGFSIALTDETVVPFASGHFTLYVAASGFVALLIRYALSIATFSVTGKPVPKNKQPPLLPYFLPGVGSLPLTFLWNPLRFAHRCVFYKSTV
jgi:hypothetical protein